MKKVLRILSIAFVCLLLGSALVSCNTMRGFGRDVSATGHAIRDAFTR